MANKVYTAAEELLISLGITHPSEIDLEAIAWHLGAVVKYRNLKSCEARIVGTDHKAIITVNKRSSETRKRFSIAHELGHWKYHRGRILMCSNSEIDRPTASASPDERTADGFAGDLLMPSYLLDKYADLANGLNFQVIEKVSQLFRTSLTATAIRLVDKCPKPTVLLCHGQNGRKWFKRSLQLSDWFPRDWLDAQSPAFEIVFGKKQDNPVPLKVSAEFWFDRSEARYHQVTEQTKRISAEEVLTVVSIYDTKMLA